VNGVEEELASLHNACISCMRNCPVSMLNSPAEEFHNSNRTEIDSLQDRMGRLAFALHWIGYDRRGGWGIGTGKNVNK